MAINQFKEIVDKKGYKVDSKDRAIFEKEVAKYKKKYNVAHPSEIKKN